VPLAPWNYRVWPLEISSQASLFRRALKSDARAFTRGTVLPNEGNRVPFYPQYASRASGQFLWDRDGNKYLDYVLGYGPVILGHNDPDVKQAVRDALDRDAAHCMAPLWPAEQVELTELLSQVIPNAESAMLLKTGSDATSAAVRVSRIWTGKDIVLRSGYNGWHDWSVEQEAGVPDAVRALTFEFDSSELGQLEALLKSHNGEVACVVTTPFDEEILSAGHLQKLAGIVREHDALFVLDEMRSGFRMDVGGAQSFFGIRPDLATYSKAIANGYPISALVGRRDILECLSRTKVSSTFFASPLEMIAAMTTIRKIVREDVVAKIWDLGTSFINGLQEIVASEGLPGDVVGYAPIPFLKFRDGHGMHAARFSEECAKDGVLIHPDHQWFISAAHTADDIEHTLSVMEVAAKKVARL
jgi:glutamate-1-semialdehyde 2,1-aminomutase